MTEKRTAAQAGWHISDYNVIAWSDELAQKEGQPVPIVANLFAGTLARSSVLELALLNSLDQMPETHPILERFEKLGWIVDFDELERIDQMAGEVFEEPPTTVTLMICPTMNCNFDCIYCFEKKRPGLMSEETQDAVAGLVDRILATSGAKQIRLDWYGGEPLLGASVIRRIYPLINEVCTKYGAGLYSHVVTNGYLLTEDNVRMLAKCHTRLVRVTLDGTRESHNASRPLVGGGPSYDRLIENISRPLPFPVEIRMNVHKGNNDEIDQLKAELDRIAEETGNTFLYRPSEVFENVESEKRGTAPDILELDELRMVSLSRIRMGLHGAHGTHCPGQNPYDICIDEMGGLHGCQATLSKHELAFGDAWTWDPANPMETATNQKMLKWYKHDSLAVNNEECRECVLLPLCMGGCAYERSIGDRDCLPWKDDPQKFVLVQYGRLGEKRRDRTLTPQDIAKTITPILEKWGVAKAWVHGSVALGTAHAGSDVDLIVQMPEGKHLGYGLFDLRKELSEAMGRWADLHTPLNDYSTPAVAAFIRRHQVLIYDAENATPESE